MDMADMTGHGRLLHTVYLGARVSRCLVVADKEASTIARALLSHRIGVFRATRVLLSNPGQDFHNALLRAL